MKRSKKILIALTSIFVFTAIVVVLLFFVYDSQLQAVSSFNENETIIFTINKGDTAKTVSERLGEAGLVKNSLFTYFYSRLSGNTGVKVGSYELNQGMSVREIFKKITSKTGAIVDDVMITITEGKWASEIADIIDSKTRVYKIDLIRLWNDEDYIRSLMSDYPFITEEVFTEGIRFCLEGYLFPNTYSIRKNSTPNEVTRIFLNETLKIYNKYKDDIEKSGYTFHQILTMASIVQYESGKDSDNAAIAQVFYNRINNPKFETGGYLQSNVTAQYAWGTRNVNTEIDSNKYIKSPLNTYYVKGLPVGPCCNPGEACIKAALNPDENYKGYYYFLSDSKGVVHYARTYAEHLQNDAKY